MSINMIEPTDPTERQNAIRICRANAWLNPDTGKPMTEAQRLRGIFSKICEETGLPYSKWLWMWNYGQEEWDPHHNRSAEGQ